MHISGGVLAGDVETYRPIAKGGCLLRAEGVVEVGVGR